MKSRIPPSNPKFDSSSFFIQGKLLYHKKRYDIALDYINKHLKTQPSHAEAWLYKV